MSEQRTTHKIQRSTTGSEAGKKHKQRTSESGWVDDGNAMPILEYVLSYNVSLTNLIVPITHTKSSVKIGVVLLCWDSTHTTRVLQMDYKC